MPIPGIIADSYNAPVGGSSYPVIAGSSFNSYTSGLTRNVTPHASVATGDLLIVFGTDVGSTATMTAPAGWTELKAHTTTGTLGTGCWARIRQVGDTNYDFVMSASGTQSTHSCLNIRNWTGNIAHIIIGANGTRAASGGAFITTAPSVTTITNNSLVLCLAGERTTSTETGISSVGNSFTEVQWVGHQATGIETVWVGKKEIATPQAVGTTSITYQITQASNGLAFHLVIPSVISTWTPLDLGSALFLWHDASDTASITDAGGGKISQWNDKSANVRHMIQATDTSRPYTGLRTINGLNTVEFNFAGSTNSLIGVTGVTLPQPFTWAVVSLFDNIDTGGRNMVTSGTIFFRTNSGLWSMNAGVNLTGGTDDANSHVHVGIFNGASSVFRRDAAIVASGDAGSGGIAAATLTYGRSTLATTWDGLIGEVIITNTAMAGADLTSLETYLKTKWGIV